MFKNLLRTCITFLLALVLDTSCSCPDSGEFTFEVEAPSVHYYKLKNRDFQTKQEIKKPNHLNSFPGLIELRFKVSDIKEMLSLGLISTSKAKSPCDPIDTYFNEDPFTDIFIHSILPTDSFFNFETDVTDSLLKFQHLNPSYPQKDLLLLPLNSVFDFAPGTNVTLPIFIPRPKTNEPFQLELTLHRESGKIVKLKTAVIK